MNVNGHSGSGRPPREEREPAAIRLSQPVGIRLEALRASGLSDRVLLEALKNADTEVLRRAVQTEWDWNILLQFAESSWGDCEKAIREGYSYKYLTIRGLKHLLGYRYRLKEGEDYFDGGTYLERVKLKRRDLASLRKTLSEPWAIVEQDEQEESDTLTVTVKWAYGAG